MEMCYDGALVMPSNYAVMSEDEMTYVDGGFYIRGSSIRAAIMTFSHVYATAPQLVAAGITAVSAVVKRVWATILSWIGASFGGFAGQVAGAAIGLYTGAQVAWKFAAAAISGKGLEITWNGISVK